MIGIATIFLMFLAALAAQVVPTMPPPLDNLGAHCYMNSTLQVLAHLPPIKVGNEFIQLFQKQPVDAGRTAFDEYIYYIIQSIRNGDTHNLPHEAIGPIMEFLFGDRGQKDAGENLMLINMYLGPKYEQDWNKYFGYQLQYERYHLNQDQQKCGHSGPIEDDFQLWIPIPQQQTAQLQQLINNYLTQPSTLDDDNQIACELNNKKKFQLTESRTITKLPPCFIITLKRFNRFLKKITTPVTVKENITINSVDYTLHAIICHSGDLGGGHYWAHVKKDGAWYTCNDSSINRTDFATIASSEFSYIFFFIKTESLQQQTSSLPELQNNQIEKPSSSLQKDSQEKPLKNSPGHQYFEQRYASPESLYGLSCFINKQDTPQKKTALHYAAAKDSAEIILNIINTGIAYPLNDSAGHPPEFYALTNSNSRIIFNQSQPRRIEAPQTHQQTTWPSRSPSLK